MTKIGVMNALIFSYALETWVIRSGDRIRSKNRCLRDAGTGCYEYHGRQEEQTSQF